MRGRAERSSDNGRIRVGYRLTAGLVVLALAAACGADGTGPGGSTGESGQQAALPSEGDATVLRDRELVASISPSGRYLLTADDAARVEGDELVSDVCVRSGERYEVIDCVALPDAAVWSASWSPGEERVAFTHAGSQRRGEHNDVVRVLDIAQLRSWPVSPVDAWLPASPFAAWTPAGELVHLLPQSERRYLVYTAAGPVTDSTTTDVDLPAVVDGVRITGLDVDADGLVVTGETEAGVTETRRWTADGPGAAPLVPGVGRTEDILAADPAGGRVVTRFFDTHGSPPPELRDRLARSSVLDADDSTVWAVDFAPGGRYVAALLIGTDEAAVAVYEIADDLALTERSVVPMAARPDRRSFPSFVWTDRGVVVEGRTDGRPGLVFRVTPGV